jgi:hypothetical protein
MVTAVAPVKLVPVIVTTVPPAVEPLPGVMLVTVTVGATATRVTSSEPALKMVAPDPSRYVTRKVYVPSTSPLTLQVSAGAVAVQVCAVGVDPS